MARVLFNGISTYFRNQPFIQADLPVRNAFAGGDSLFFQSDREIIPTLSTTIAGDIGMPVPYTNVYQTGMLRSALLQTPLIARGRWADRSYQGVMFTTSAMVNVRLNPPRNPPQAVVPQSNYIYDLDTVPLWAANTSKRNYVYTDLCLTTLEQMDTDGFAIPLLFNELDNDVDSLLGLTSRVGQNWTSIVCSMYDSYGNMPIQINDPIHSLARSLMILYLGSAVGYFNSQVTWNGFYFRQVGKNTTWFHDVDPVLTRGDSALQNRVNGPNQINRWIVYRDPLWQMSRSTIAAMILGAMITNVEVPADTLVNTHVQGGVDVPGWCTPGGRPADFVTTYGIRFVCIDILRQIGYYTAAEAQDATDKAERSMERDRAFMIQIRDADDANFAAGNFVRRVKPWANGAMDTRVQDCRAIHRIMAAGTVAP
nr:core clamp [Largemouth bass reovirus]